MKRVCIENASTSIDFQIIYFCLRSNGEESFHFPFHLCIKICAFSSFIRLLFVLPFCAIFIVWMRSFIRSDVLNLICIFGFYCFQFLDLNFIAVMKTSSEKRLLLTTRNRIPLIVLWAAYARFIFTTAFSRKTKKRRICRITPLNTECA